MNTQATVDFLLRSSLFSMMRMYNIIAAEHGITQSVGNVLLIIEKGGTPATKVAPLMGMSSSSLSRLLKNMEESGFIYKETNSIDKRVIKVFLTDKGLELRRIVRKVVVGFNDRVAKKVKAEEMEAFTRVTQLIKELAQEDMLKFQMNKN